MVQQNYNILFPSRPMISAYATLNLLSSYTFPAIKEQNCTRYYLLQYQLCNGVKAFCFDAKLTKSMPIVFVSMAFNFCLLRIMAMSCILKGFKLPEAQSFPFANFSQNCVSMPHRFNCPSTYVLFEKIMT